APLMLLRDSIGERERVAKRQRIDRDELRIRFIEAAGIDEQPQPLTRGMPEVPPAIRTDPVSREELRAVETGAARRTNEVSVEIALVSVRHCWRRRAIRLVVRKAWRCSHANLTSCSSDARAKRPTHRTEF